MIIPPFDYHKYLFRFYNNILILDFNFYVMKNCFPHHYNCSLQDLTTVLNVKFWNAPRLSFSRFFFIIRHNSSRQSYIWLFFCIFFRRQKKCLFWADMVWYGERKGWRDKWFVQICRHLTASVPPNPYNLALVQFHGEHKRRMNRGLVNCKTMRIDSQRLSVHHQKRSAVVIGLVNGDTT